VVLIALTSKRTMGCLCSVGTPDSDYNNNNNNDNDNGAYDINVAAYSDGRDDASGWSGGGDYGGGGGDSGGGGGDSGGGGGCDSGGGGD